MTEQTGAGRRYPAPMEDILRAQEAGARAYAEGPGVKCPYGTYNAQERFLRSQWAMGRAMARVEAHEASRRSRS